MLPTEERRKIEAQVEAKCAEFETLSWEIICAGFAVPGFWSNPFLYLRDCDGGAWKKQAHEMNATDVVEYIDHKFGPLYVRFLRDHFNNMTTH